MADDDAKPKPAQASLPTAATPASTDKATAAASSSSSSWEDEEATVPDISAVLAKLSLDESKASKKKQEDDVTDKRSSRRAPVPPPPPPPPPATTSKASIRQQQKPEPSARAPATPVQRRKPPSHQHAQATPSPTLSRYGADLGDIRDVVRDLPPEDVLAHGLYLWGFPSSSSSSSAIEREALTAPWTAVGALIIWLPPHDTCAVAMFYSIPTANRALRQVQAPAGVTAQSLKRASAEVQQQALAAGLSIPPRPKGDTDVASRLIIGALGIRSPSSTRPSIDGAAAGGVRRSSRIREQQEAAAATAKRGGGEGDDGGSWGDA